MFGIGGGELVVILILLLLAVGPDRMPTFMKAVGKGVREFRRTTRDIRSTVGIDELLRDEDLRDPLGMNRPVKPRTVASKPSAPPSESGTAASPSKALSAEQLRREQPPEGVDIAQMQAAAASSEEPEPR